MQGSVATYLKCGGIVNNHIKKGLLLSLAVIFFKSVNIWQSYKQERDCLVHFLRLLSSVLATRAKCHRVFTCLFCITAYTWTQTGNSVGQSVSFPFGMCHLLSIKTLAVCSTCLIHYSCVHVKCSFNLPFIHFIQHCISALTLLVGWQEGHPACKN